MKKKILFITELFPFPADSGGKIKTLNTIITLSKKFEIYLVCFSEHPVSSIHLRYIKKYVKNADCFIHLKVSASPQKNILNLALSYIRLMPFYCYRYNSKKATKRINTIIDQLNPNLIYIDHLPLAQYLPQIKNELWVYEEHNIEHQMYLLLSHNSRSIKRKIYYFLEYILLFLMEAHFLPKFDHIYTISKSDLIFIKAKYNKNTSLYAPVI